jgi:serine/threonine protein kinase
VVGNVGVPDGGPISGCCSLDVAGGVEHAASAIHDSRRRTKAGSKAAPTSVNYSFDTDCPSRNHLAVMADAAVVATAGNYRILSKIADGGMGTVYRGEHSLIGRRVAIKVLLPEFTANQEIVHRFFNEAKATSAIQHPGIVEIFDFGYLDTGAAYIVMELLDGVTLARRIKERGMMGEGEAAALLRAVCNALAAAHDKGIVHRDLKPDNIFLVPDLESATGERPKLLDFGIAKLTDLGGAGGATKTGAVMGTPTYMSPEQCRGSGDVDQRADLYSLGCIYYQLLVGRPPFANHGAGEVIGQHLFVEPKPPTQFRADIAPDTEALIMRLLQKDPALRPQSARELAAELQALAHRYGWLTASMPPGAISQEMLAHMPQPTPQFTPSYTPSYTPSVQVPVAAPNQPTTLSGAASQSVVRPGRSRLGVAIPLALLVSAGLGAGAFFAFGRGDDLPSRAASPAPVVEPAPQPPAPPVPPVPPVPVPAPVQVAQPTPPVPRPAPAVTHTVAVKKPVHVEPKPKTPANKPDVAKPDLPLETTVE